MNESTNKLIELSKKCNRNVELDDYFPRILINVNNDEDKYNVMTLAHELGHHFINVNGEDQSENLADKFIYDIFLVYLPDFFIAIEHIMLGIKLKINYGLDIDYKKMYNSYLKFREEHPEMKLPILN